MGHDAEGGGLRLSTAFRRTRGGGVSAAFHQVEIELLRSLVDQLLELVRGQPGARDPRLSDDPLIAALGLGDDPSRPTDPVVLRLFPDGYRDDDEAAAEFRRFTERSLRETKAESAATMLATLEAVRVADPAKEDVSKREKVRLRLDAPQAQAWLRTLTDLRLALGTRLGVEEGDDEHWEALADDDPRRHIHDVYEWLGWVQETLVRALSAGLR
ncbi:MAG TPA: DUF2017 domain-containing protein [Jiangellaceae bacterium]